MVSREDILRTIERATGYDDAWAYVDDAFAYIDDDKKFPLLILAAKGIRCDIKLDTPLEDNLHMAKTICRSMVQRIHSQICEREIEVIEW